MKQFDFITIGSATQDIMYYTTGGEVVPHYKQGKKCDGLIFSLGSKFEIAKTYYFYGGGANNTAVSLSRLGFKVGTIMAIGVDAFGNQILKNLVKEKVAVNLIQKIKTETTGLSLIINNQKDERYVLFVSRGANKFLTFSAQKNRSLQTKWLYVNSLNFVGWQKIIEEIIKYKLEHPKVKIYWNPGDAQICDGGSCFIRFFALVDVLQVNKTEAVDFVEHILQKKSKAATIQSLLKSIYKLGSKIVVITDGGKGCYAYDGKKFYHQLSLRAKPVDTTGAGDGFGSSFVAGLEMFKGDINKALKTGIINASSVISEPGAHNGLLRRKDILKRL